MRSYVKYCVLISMFLMLYACTKVINVDLNASASQIVIEGNITNTAGPFQVQISKTVNVSESNIYPPVSGATVKIMDNTAGITDLLSETTTGIYKTHTIQGISGHTYQLSVLSQGQTYTASSTMPPMITLDSISFQHNGGRPGNTTINPVANFQDPAGVDNYYSFAQFINSKPLKGTAVTSDRLSDGRYISQQIFSDSSYINVGDTVTLQMNCIDKAVWTYFYTLVQATNGNSFRSAAPSNPVSNISNNALGYFSASTITTKKRIAK